MIDREKARARYRRYYWRHRDKVLTYQRDHAEVTREQNRRRYEQDGDAIRAQRNAYHRAHPETNRRASHRRRTRQQGGGVYLVTDRDWQRLVHRFDGRCAYCRKATRLEAEHVIPISRGGRHSIGNLLPSCGPCNRRKFTRLLIEWDGRKGVAT